VVAASRKKPLSSAVATTVNSANFVYYPLLYNYVHVPVSANITSLPQPAPIMLPQTTDAATTVLYGKEEAFLFVFDPPQHYYTPET
jgi:hypothetical protein